MFGVGVGGSCSVGELLLRARLRPEALGSFALGGQVRERRCGLRARRLRGLLGAARLRLQPRRLRPELFVYS